MKKIQLIDNELMECMVELSKLSGKYENKNECSSSHTEVRATPLGSESSDWFEKRDEWEKEKTNPTLLELYTYHIKSPTPDVLMDYMCSVFMGSDVYRYAVFNFLGMDLKVSIWKKFYWFFVIHVKRGTYLTLKNYLSPGDPIEDLGHVDRSASCRQFYLKLKFDERLIFLTWIRPSESELEVIFSHSDFCTSKIPFDDLKKQCE
jgi:hypothetical protein